MTGLRDALKLINGASSIAISCHTNPDGDCLGSMLGLGLGLEKRLKKVFLLSPDGIPLRYRHLPGARRVKNFTTEKVDLAIAVDCSAKEMLGRTRSVFERSAGTLEIDHHAYRRPLGGPLFLDVKAAAVGEMVYLLLDRLGVDMTEEIAQNIITSIVVETNSFRLPTVNPFTFHVCSSLMKTGFDYHSVSELVYWSRSREASWMLGVCLGRSRIEHNGRLIWSIAYKKDLKRIKAELSDIDPVANELLSVKGVEISVFFREQGSRILRVSLRSKGRVNVAAIAEVYEGGGHFDSAGCLIPNSPKARQGLLKLVKESL